MGVDLKTFVPLPVKLVFCHGHMVRPYSPEAKRKRWLWRHLAHLTMNSVLTLYSKKKPKNSCCSTISHLFQLVKLNLCVHLDAEKLGMATWQKILCKKFCQIQKVFLTRFALFQKFLNPMDLHPWPLSAGAL